jgi:GAF domain-containing protein/HAMP domain-containing protein
MLFALNGIGLGLLIRAQSPQEARIPMALVAATTTSNQPFLFLAAVAMLRVRWFSSRVRWPLYFFYLLGALPIILTVIDLIFGTNLWFSGAPANYIAGYVDLPEYAHGLFAAAIRSLTFSVVSVIILCFLFYIALLARGEPRNRRLLAWILLGVQFISFFLEYFLAARNLSVLAHISSISLFGIVYAYAGFQQMISERRYQSGSIQNRMTGLVLAVTVPVMIAISVIVMSQSRSALEEDAANVLATNSISLSRSVRTYLDVQIRALDNLVSQPDIYNMDPAAQKPVLQALVHNYPEINLASTIDLNGSSVARSDDLPVESFRSQSWFQRTVRGDMGLQSEIRLSSGKEALILSKPIISEDGSIVGVAILASDIGRLSEEIQSLQPSRGIVAFLINENNSLFAHSGAFNAVEFQDMSEFPPVQALRNGSEGSYRYTDSDGLGWRAYLQSMDNDWAVIVQQSEADFIGPIRRFSQVPWMVTSVGGVLLFVLVWFTVRQSLFPIRKLTETAAAIRSGDINRTAPVEGEDEFGVLAAAFNGMTAQLRDLIMGLEQRVNHRTRELERRNLQMQTAAVVAQEAASIRDLNDLLDHVTEVISERFNFYHTGVFILDDANEYAILQAANSEGGKRMLARGHRLKIGQVGIVGFVAAKGEPRIALDVGDDLVYFDNPDLPRTRSEMALPLMIKDRVIGVLDVQSVEASAFSQADVDVLQLMADQIALAMENARLLQESRAVANELDRLYGQQTHQDWLDRLMDKELAYQYTPLVTQKMYSNDHDHNAVMTDQAQIQSTVEGHELVVPIRLRGRSLGAIILRRSLQQEKWTSEEMSLVEDVLSQIIPAMDNARLLEQIRQQAYQQTMVSEITNRVRSTIQLDTIMQNAVKEIGRVFGASRTFIQLGVSDEQAGLESRLIQPEN